MMAGSTRVQSASQQCRLSKMPPTSASPSGRSKETSSRATRYMTAAKTTAASISNSIPNRMFLKFAQRLGMMCELGISRESASKAK